MAVDAARKKACLKKPTKEICIKIIITINIHINGIVITSTASSTLMKKSMLEKEANPCFHKKKRVDFIRRKNGDFLKINKETAAFLEEKEKMETHSSWKDGNHDSAR